VAAPVGAAETCDEFEHIVDEIVCLKTPQPFRAVGIWYEDFGQTSDQEVRDLLEEAVRPRRLLPHSREAGQDSGSDKSLSE
jgi:predicted phosphoribosyltransferase